MRSKVTRYRVKCAQELHGRILDIGAGEGHYTSYLRGEVVSLDPDFENLSKVLSTKVVGSAEGLPFPDNTFDAIWSCAVLEHVKKNYIPNAIRVTKPGGIIYILTPNRNSLYDPIKRLFGFGDWWSNEGHVRLYAAHELRKYGKIWGEVWWAPGLDQVARVFPFLGHTLMLRIEVSAQLKARFVFDDRL